ncbi:MAG: nuclease [Sphingomonas bacterium]|nr:nuclease [Sphingomonas bacterium]
MTTFRKIARLHPALRDDIEDLQTRRPVPGPGLDHLGPFLFLNHHGPQVYPPRNHGLPFGPHPHRGFETVTFILQGSLTHRDTAGHESIIHEGGVQWMTAGSGLVHEEVSSQAFKRDGGPLEILQLWVNLPARLKMTPPRYTGVQHDAIPAIASIDGLATVNLVSGGYAGQTGPIPSLTGVFMTTIEAKAGAKVAFDGLAGREVFLYVARGAITIDDQPASAANLAALTEGDAVEIIASEDSLVVFGHGDPINEPIVASGPFVMNTEVEIRQAFADYRAGRFGAPA